MSRLDEKFRILLGSEDIISRSNQDIFLNIDLNRTFYEFKKQIFNNEFDLARQFEIERNSSRNFVLYGIVDSNIVDTDNLFIELFSGITTGGTPEGLILTAYTTPLAYNQKNLFGKKRGKYFFEILNYTGENQTTVYINIPSDGKTYTAQTYEQVLVFYDSDGVFVNYGTESLEIGLSGEIVEIRNDFPYFYERHWIKKNLNIVEEKPKVVSFKNPSIVIQEGQTTGITVTLDRPSVFGIEKVEVDLNLLKSETTTSDYSLSTTLPLTLTWSPGEQEKIISPLGHTIDFFAISDSIIELSEKAVFSLKNNVNCKLGTFSEQQITIKDITPRRLALFNFQNIWNNRLMFNPDKKTVFGGGTTDVPTSAILRNGHFFNNLNREFYPNNTFKLTITNIGNDTLLPTISGFTTSEGLFLAGDSKEFNITTKYDGTSKHKYFIKFGTGAPPPSPTLNINGVYYLATNLSTFKTYHDSAIYSFYDRTYTITDVIGGLEITSLPGIPLYVSTNAPSYITITEIDKFVEANQKPFEIPLYANFAGGAETLYQFRIEKNGYFPLIFTSNTPTVLLGSLPLRRYLVTGYRYMLRNWDFDNNTCLYTSDYTVYTSTTVNAYINGAALLAVNENNKTFFGDTAIATDDGYGYADFLSAPINIKTCTIEDTLTTGKFEKDRVTVSVLPTTAIVDYKLTLSGTYYSTLGVITSFSNTFTVRAPNSGAGTSLGWGTPAYGGISWPTGGASLAINRRVAILKVFTHQINTTLTSKGIKATTFSTTSGGQYMIVEGITVPTIALKGTPFIIPTISNLAYTRIQEYALPGSLSISNNHLKGYNNEITTGVIIGPGGGTGSSI